MRIFIICILLGSLLSEGFGQQMGCTDPLAVNFDVNAVVNDGSCRYTPIVHSPPFAFELPAEVRETSGLVFHNGNLWTHNDSGDGPLLYALDTSSAQVVARLTLSNATAVDWEEITSDEEYLYIGDFGNNTGNRRDLVIYRIKLDALPKEGNAKAKADKINFYYPEQKDFKKSKTHSFDCEAFISYNGSLYLFTKDRGQQNTQLYRLPATPGNHAAEFIAGFNSGGLITGASLNMDDNELILVGYVQKVWTPFIWIFNDFEEDNFFSGNKRRIDLVNLLTTQTEAVCYMTNKRYWISAESSPTFSARVFSFDSSPWTDSITQNVKGRELNKTDLNMLPASDGGWGSLVVRSQVKREVRLDISDPHGKLLHRSVLILNRNKDYEVSLQGIDIPGDEIIVLLISGRKHMTRAFKK
jgi:hypothetical protein